MSKETEKDTELEKEENTSAESLPKQMTSISDLWLNMITSEKEAQRKDWSLQTQQREM